MLTAPYFYFLFIFSSFFSFSFTIDTPMMLTAHNPHNTVWHIVLIYSMMFFIFILFYFFLLFHFLNFLKFFQTTFLDVYRLYLNFMIVMYVLNKNILF